MAATTAPYGSWVSPITSDVVIKESISLMEVRIDPFQEGRTIIEVGATKIKRQRSEIEVTRRLEKKKKWPADFFGTEAFYELHKLAKKKPNNIPSMWTEKRMDFSASIIVGKLRNDS